MRRQCVCILIGSVALMLPGRVHGEILGIEVVQTTYPGMPGFLFSYNLYVTFSDPGDGVVGVFGGRGLGDPLRFETNVVSGFHQEFQIAGDQDFSVDSDVLSAWPSLAWDTYIDIGYKSGDYGPQDPYSTEAIAIDFSTWNDGGSFLETDFVDGGGYYVLAFDTTHQHIAGPDLRVFIGQLVVVAGLTNDGGPPRISGHVSEIVWYSASTGHNEIAGVAFDFASVGESPDPVTRYVGGDAPDGGDGMAWSTAFCFLKDALDVALDPAHGLAEIRVAQGVHRPDRTAATPGGSGDRGSSFQLPGGVTLRGGYAGPGAPDPDARDVELYETILSGDLGGDDQPGLVNTGDNSYHVVFANGAGPPAVLDGITVTGGNADGTGLDNLGGGMFVIGPSVIVVNCKFIENAAGFKGGAVFAAGEPTLVNCVFSRNAAEHGGGLFTSTAASIVNCTFTDNTGAALVHDDNAGLLDVPLVYSCIFWGNLPEQVGSFPDAPGVSPVLRYCNVQGGWTGFGTANIDADPLFVRPGCDDLRLSVGSPCADVGYNPGLPPDTLDLDGDGDTDEPIPVDLAGSPRIVGGIVDLGAYEGEFDPLPATAEDADFDNGETALLVPRCGPFNPLQDAVVIATNATGPDNATITVTERSSDTHPGAGGYSELAVTLALETSLSAGQYGATVFVPFDLDDLAGVDPLAVNLTYFDPSVGNWGLAVAGNTLDAPGFNGPIGHRVAREGGGKADWGLTTALGDYGVFWNPTVQQGFAWANVDHAADFAIGAALCPADCRQTPDGVVDVLDLIALLLVYGSSGGGGGGPCDLNRDGVVDVLDLILLLGEFGTFCQ